MVLKWHVAQLRYLGGTWQVSIEIFQGRACWVGGVVLKGIIMDILLGGCGCLQRMNFWQFQHFPFWEGMVVLKDQFCTVLILGGCGDLYLFSTVSTLRGNAGHGRTNFEIFWGCYGGLKGMIYNIFDFRRMWWSLKDSLWKVSTLGGCDGVKGIDFEQFPLCLVWWSWETECEQFPFWKNMVVFKDWFWKFSKSGGSGIVERTDFQWLPLVGCGGPESTDLM